MIRAILQRRSCHLTSNHFYPLLCQLFVTDGGVAKQLAKPNARHLDTPAFSSHSWCPPVRKLKSVCPMDQGINSNTSISPWGRYSPPGERVKINAMSEASMDNKGWVIKIIIYEYSRPSELDSPSWGRDRFCAIIDLDPGGKTTAGRHPFSTGLRCDITASASAQHPVRASTSKFESSAAKCFVMNDVVITFVQQTLLNTATTCLLSVCLFFWTQTYEYGTHMSSIF